MKAARLTIPYLDAEGFFVGGAVKGEATGAAFFLSDFGFLISRLLFF